jgi:phosphatidylserine/phosphatidylglycerophosphate/cardiolipin synthase-like enzyme
MAKFLTTIDIAANLQTLITEADETLYLVSPYLQISNDFQELLVSREKKKKETVIIYGKSELNPVQLKFLTSLRYLYLKFYEKLHAKCYINDTKLIITSMNFYEYSMINNKEMGVIYDTAEVGDKEIYRKALEYVQLIEDNSDDKPFELNVDYTKPNSTQRKKLEIKEKDNKIEEKPVSSKGDYSKSKLLKTKQLSEKTGISSRKVNAWFVDNKLMYKKNDAWFTTKKGKEIGGTEKDGFYGQEVLWPEELADQIK